MMRFFRPSGVRYRFLPSDRVGLLPWLVAALSFVAGLALVGALALEGAASQVRDSSQGRATVQIVTSDPAQRVNQTIAALTLLQQDAAVIGARELPRSEIESLLRPWLGPGVTTGNLPLPGMIDIELKDGAAVATLETRLRTVAPAARLDVHSDWLGSTERTLRALQGLSLMIVALISVAASAMVALAVRASLDGARPIVELLHGMGAEDADVAVIFEHRSAWQALTGGALGCAVAALAAFALSSGGTGLTISWTAWVALGALPLVIGLLAGVAARFSVRAALRAMP